MARNSNTVINESQLSFFELLEADDSTYEVICAARDNRYELKFTSEMAHIIIRDSIYILTASRSNLQQRIDEILWVFSDNNQDNLCSFTNCCEVTDMDPAVVRSSIKRRWKKELELIQYAIDTGHHSAPSNMDYYKCQLDGYELYEKAFHIHRIGFDKYESQFSAKAKASA